MKLFDIYLRLYDLKPSNIGPLLERYKTRFSKEFRGMIDNSIKTINDRAVQEAVPIHSLDELFHGIPLKCILNVASYEPIQLIYACHKKSVYVHENEKRIAIAEFAPDFERYTYYQLPYNSFNFVPRRIMEEKLQAYDFKYQYFTKKETKAICDLIYKK